MSLFFHTICLLSRKVILNKRLKATQTPKRGEKKVKEKNKTSSCLFIFSKNFALQRRYGEFTGSVEMNTQRNQQRAQQFRTYGTKNIMIIMTTTRQQNSYKSNAKAKPNQTETYTRCLSLCKRQITDKQKSDSFFCVFIQIKGIERMAR